MTTPTPLTYNAYVTALGALGVYDVTTVNGVNHLADPVLDTIIPSALDYAEGRIARDLDLSQSLTTGSYTVSGNTNVLPVPVGDFVTIQTIAVNGVPLLPVSKEFLQNVYGTNANPGAPVYFAPYGGDSSGGNTSQNFLLGPYTDTSYTASVTGTVRLPSLATNATQSLAGSATTFISTWLPDLLVMASMIYVSLYQRNFGAASNDPEMPGSYESQYEILLKGAMVEEARRKFQASAWSSMSPPLVATPTR